MHPKAVTWQEWTLRGYFKEPETVKRPREAFPGIDLITQVGFGPRCASKLWPFQVKRRSKASFFQVDESYGRDIGSEVPLCLLEAIGSFVRLRRCEERPKTLSREARESLSITFSHLF